MQIQQKAAELSDVQIKEPEKAAKRTVRLVMKQCCGCGCWNVEIERLVDNDSPLKDGDYIGKSTLLPGDKQIRIVKG